MPFFLATAANGVALERCLTPGISIASWLTGKTPVARKPEVAFRHAAVKSSEN